MTGLAASKTARKEIVVTAFILQKIRVKIRARRKSVGQDELDWNFGKFHGDENRKDMGEDSPSLS